MSRIAILGTGAVGGYYGALLARAGQDVHFLLRTDYIQVKNHGLRVDSVDGDFRLDTVRAYSDALSMPKCDIAILAWKTTDNAQLKKILPLILKPGGMVLVLQNGLDPEKDVAALVPGATIIGGMCFLCARKEGPGWIRHLSYGAITLAEYISGNAPAAGVTDAMRVLEQAFALAGVEIRLQPDWRVARWTKLVWNIPFNGLCTVLNANTSQLLRHPLMRNLVAQMMAEVTTGAKACGVVLAEKTIEKMLANTDTMAAYEPSMKLDFSAGRPMELEAIYSRPCQAILKAGGTAPRIETLLAQLQCMEAIRT